MNIHVILVVYALDVRSLVAELEAPDVFFHLYTHSRRVEATEICYWAQSLHPNISLHDYGINRGLARSWSDGIVEATEMNADAIVIVNDDIRMSRLDLKYLASSAIAHREAGVIVVTGENVRMQGHLDLGYSVFAINPIAVEKVGMFDVNYWPIYGEDVDYSRRLTLAGVPILNAGDTDVVHQGSMSVAVAPELKESHHQTFSANEAYHRLKHGGGYGHEVYLHPFNDPALSWKIEAENRDNPYPQHKRTGQNIVKI